jgi:hypothetical protein
LFTSLIRNKRNEFGIEDLQCSAHSDVKQVEVNKNYMYNTASKVPVACLLPVKVSNGLGKKDGISH